MTEDTPADVESDDAFGRRRFLAGSAALGAAAVTPAFAGAAAAQPDSGEDKTAPAAIPDSAPMFGNPDYTGLLVQVSGYDREASTEGVGGCAFVDSEDDLTGYDAEIIDTYNEDHQSEAITMFAVTQANIKPGKLFVVNDQEPSCPDEYVRVQLEEIGSSSIETPGEGDGSAGGTGSSIPGFGVLAGVLGLGAAAAAAARSDD